MYTTFLVAAFLACGLKVWGAPATGALLKAFIVPITDPKTGRLKAVISGKEARPNLKTGLTEMRGATLTNFAANGEAALVMEAPNCVFNLKENAINSPGALEVRSGNGQLTITGTGFLWRQSETNSTLVISNDVHTAIRRDLIKSPLSAPAGRSNGPTLSNTNVEVSAGRLDFESQSNLAIYRGNVVAKDAERLNLTCELLTAVLPQAGGRFENLLAQENVVLDLQDKAQKIRVTGDKALYTLSRENRDLLNITGHPAWRTRTYEGKGEFLTLDAGTNSFEFTVRSNASVRLPRSILSNPTLLGENTTALAPPVGLTNQYLEISSEEYEFKPGSAVFHGDVQVNNAPDWNLSSGNLTVALPGAASRLESIIAEENVVIDLIDKDAAGHATGDRAIYRATGDKMGMVELSGNPTWRTRDYEGAGEVLVLNPGRKEFEAKNHASLKLLNHSLVLAGAAPVQPAGRTNGAGGAIPELLIRSTEYHLSSNVVTFDGNVEVEQPGWRLTCDRVVANLSTNNNRVEHINAQGDVAMEQTADRNEPSSAAGKNSLLHASAGGPGWTMTCEEMDFRMTGNQVAEVEARRNVIFQQGDSRATGEQAVYLPATEIMRLTGNPRMVKSDGTIVTAKVLILNRKSNTFEAEGNFKVEIPHAALLKPGRSPAKK